MNEQNTETQENASEHLQSSNPSLCEATGESSDSKKTDKQKSMYIHVFPPFWY